MQARKQELQRPYIQQEQMIHNLKVKIFYFLRTLSLLPHTSFQQSSTAYFSFLVTVEQDTHQRYTHRACPKQIVP